MEDEYKTLREFASELDLHFNEENIDYMYKLLDSGMDPSSLILLLRDIKNELSENGIM